MAGRAAAIVSTCGKALGLQGAFAAGPPEVIDCLLNRARSFIFSTAVSPVLAAGIAAAGIAVIEDNPYGDLWFDAPPPLPDVPALLTSLSASPVHVGRADGSHP